VSEKPSTASAFAMRLLVATKSRLGDDWTELADAGKSDVSAAAEDLADLAMRKVAGEEVDGEIAIVKSTLLDWKWVGSAKARDAFIDVLSEAFELAGAFLSRFAKGLL